MDRMLMAVCLLIWLLWVSSAWAQKAPSNRKQIDRIRIEAVKDNGVINFKDFVKYDNSKSTKKETEDWIVQKLNKYASKQILLHDPNSSRNLIIPAPDALYFSQSEEVTAFVASIDNDMLYFDIWKTVKTSTDKGTTTEHEKEHIAIPLNNLRDLFVSDTYGRELEFVAFDNTITGSIYSSSSYALHFEKGKEDDIEMRLIKAFVHLESFYWKTRGKETF